MGSFAQIMVIFAGALQQSPETRARRYSRRYRFIWTIRRAAPLSVGLFRSTWGITIPDPAHGAAGVLRTRRPMHVRPIPPRPNRKALAGSGTGTAAPKVKFIRSPPPFMENESMG